MPASAFLPVARFRATRFESAPPGPERLYFDWHTVDHCELGDAIFVRVQFRVVDNSQRRSYRWHFDDGAEDTGLNPRHFFPQPGLRQVTVEALQNGAVAASNSVRVRVSPEWQQTRLVARGRLYSGQKRFPAPRPGSDAGARPCRRVGFGRPRGRPGIAHARRRNAGETAERVQCAGLWPGLFQDGPCL